MTNKMQAYWDSIRKEFPKAFEELRNDHNTKEEWGYIDIPEIWGTFIDESHYVLRHLYDFFDSKGFPLWVYPFGHQSESWIIGISIIGFNHDMYPRFSSRQEAELAAWRMGFEMLEKKLNNEQTFPSSAKDC